MASAAERLAREISELRRRLEGLERAAATELRSIDDGSLSAFDEDGNEKVVMGRQPDGSYGLQGFNGGKVVADEARRNAITADAILDGAVGPEKASFYGEVQDAAQAAESAQTSANEAQTLADQAAQDAADAEASALEALGVANSKAEIVYQAGAPAGDASVYWVDTDTGRGHRWDGSQWIEIQDEDVQTALSNANDAQTAANAAQTAADDAAAAASAAQDTANAAQAAADAADAKAAAAQSAADAAQADANAAQSAADDAEADALEALGVANSKADIVFQSAAPAGSAETYWVDTDTDRGHRWDGAQWVPIQDEEIQAALSDAAAAQSAADAAASDAASAQATASDAAAAAAAAQSAADAAKNRADDAYALADGKVQSFWGITDPSTTDTLGVGDLWLDEGNGNVLKRWNGSSWDVVQDEEIQEALQNASEAQATADGKITTFVGDTAPTAEGVGDFWVDTGNGNLLKRWDGTGWVPLQVGQGAIAPDAVTETEVADDSISTPKLRANAVTAAKLETVLVLASRVVAGSPYGARTEMNSSGLESYDLYGRQTFLADSDGNVYVSGTIESNDFSEAEAGWKLSSQDVQFPNVNVIGQVGAETVSGQRILVGGNDLDDVLAEKPNGLVAYGEMPGGQNMLGSTGERGWGAMTVPEPKFGHYYRITYSAFIYGDSGDVINFSVRGGKNLGGAGPTPNNTVTLWNSGKRVESLGNWRGPSVTHSFVYKETDPDVSELKLLFTSWKEFGSGGYELVNNNDFGPHVAVEHLGPAGSVEQNLEVRWAEDGSSTDSGNDSTGTYTRTWDATWGNSYNGNGNTFADGGNLYQGYYSGTHGNTRSMVGFNDSSIRSALSGATIKKVELTFRVKHDYYNSGLDVVVGHHNNSGTPGSWNAGGYADRIGQFDSLKAGGTYTVNLAQDWVGTGLRDGTIRGFTFGPGGSTSRYFYGYMYGANTGSRPRLKITYEK